MEQAFLLNNISGSYLDQAEIPSYNTITEDSGILKIVSTRPTDCKIPDRIADLNSGVDFNIYKFDRLMSASAKAMGFIGEISRKQVLFIQDFVRYQWVDCNSTKKKYGIGIRCFIHVTNYKGRIGYSSLAGIAANVELGNAKCTFHLASLGFAIDGKDLANGLQSKGDYDVENFGKLAVVFDNVLKLLNAGSNMKIEPVELPTV
jgi:hypothetical protein